MRTQAIIEDKIFVWFKDSSELVFYEASAEITDFFERGDEALTVSLEQYWRGRCHCDFSGASVRL